ncbi:spermidine synthase [Terricaulis sp.]|uniref:spermidine synthase n=1 Tax=Terricaulis sp. TaxID=2768686 RepID=UPI003782D651
MPISLNRRALAGGLIAALGASAAGPAFGQAAQYGRIARRESQYATTYIDRDGRYIAMRFGINTCLFTESLYNPADPTELPVTYTQFMTVALAYTNRATRMAEIGLGGGRIASYIHDFVPTSNITCIELDPGVVDLAQRHFGVRQDARLRIVTRDGRVFMARDNVSYDIIFVDAYQGTLVPFHLVTQEFYRILKRRLASGGVVAQNISPDVLDVNRMVATARSVFANADLYQGGGNEVLIAYDGPPKTAAQLTARATELQTAYRLRYPLANMLRTRRANVTAGGARAFTDDFAPVGYRDLDRRCRTGRG